MLTKVKGWDGWVGCRRGTGFESGYPTGVWVYTRVRIMYIMLNRIL